MPPKLITHEMKIRGVTQTSLAQKLGVTPQAVCQTVRGKGSCRIRQAIADVIGRPVEDVFSFMPSISEEINTNKQK